MHQVFLQLLMDSDLDNLLFITHYSKVSPCQNLDLSFQTLTFQVEMHINALKSLRKISAPQALSKYSPKSKGHRPKLLLELLITYRL